MNAEQLLNDSPAIILGGVAILTGIILLSLAFFFLALARKGKKELRASENWSPTQAIVLSSTAQPFASPSSSGGHTVSYYPTVTYQYNAAGQQFVGNKFSFGRQIGYGSSKHVQKMIAPYEPGRTVEVYYNPDNPSESVLQRKAKSSPILTIVAIILIVSYLCILGLIASIIWGIDNLMSYLPS